jgi:hypothetical protein
VSIVEPSWLTSDPFALGSLIALMMEAARTSETSVDIQLRTRQYIPEDSELQVGKDLQTCRTNGQIRRGLEMFVENRIARNSQGDCA